MKPLAAEASVLSTPAPALRHNNNGQHSNAVTLAAPPAAPSQEGGRWALAIDDAIARRDAIARAKKELMVEGVDYGIIPGSKRPSLMQPGAEKLCIIFAIRISYTIEVGIEDFTGAEHGGTPFFYYRIRGAAANDDGVFLGEGLGSCHLWESKYRWRNAERVCPSCGKAAIRRSNREDEQGWYCWRKPEKGFDGCGAKFPANHAEIVGQKVGRETNPDILDATNTILKMALKRAKIATVINATGASEFFGQDLEDTVTPEDPPLPKGPTVATTFGALPEGATRGVIRDLFERVRASVGDERYGYVLGEYGVRSWEGLKSREQLLAVYRRLVQLAEGRAA